MFNFFKKKKSEGAEVESTAASNISDLSKMNIKREDKNLANTVEFLSWIQEFSKKVVAVTFVVYVVSMLYALVIIALEFNITMEATYIDTFLSEINETFRNVIGGYLLKAATENVIKIGGGYMESYMSSKTTIIEQRVSAVAAGSGSDEGDGDIDFSDDPMNPTTRASKG